MARSSSSSDKSNAQPKDAWSQSTRFASPKMRSQRWIRQRVDLLRHGARHAAALIKEAPAGRNREEDPCCLLPAARHADVMGQMVCPGGIELDRTGQTGMESEKNQTVCTVR